MRTMLLRSAVKKALADTAESTDESTVYMIRCWAFGRHGCNRDLQAFVNVCSTPPEGCETMDMNVDQDSVTITLRRAPHRKLVLIFEVSRMGHRARNALIIPNMELTTSQMISPVWVTA